MPSKRPTDTHTKILVEGIDRALVWEIDRVKGEMGMNRSQAIIALLWAGLQVDGIVKGRVKAEYEEYLRSSVAAQLDQ